MKRLLVAILVLVAATSFADTAVQVDQNAGFLDLATATFAISSQYVTDVFKEGAQPGSYTTWVASFPSGQWLVVPDRTRGILINAFHGDIIVGSREDIATGAIYVGYKIASGSWAKFEGLDSNQRKVNLRIYSNSATNSSATILAW